MRGARPRSAGEFAFQGFAGELRDGDAAGAGEGFGAGSNWGGKPEGNLGGAAGTAVEGWPPAVS
jgi:hypothetical protein